MGWLKEKYRELIINFFLSILGMLFIFWITGIRDSDANIKKDIDEIKIKKAEITYVDSQNAKQDVTIERKADKSLVESMDKKLDLILQKISK